MGRGMLESGVLSLAKIQHLKILKFKTYEFTIFSLLKLLNLKLISSIDFKYKYKILWLKLLNSVTSLDATNNQKGSSEFSL